MSTTEYTLERGERHIDCTIEYEYRPGTPVSFDYAGDPSEVDLISIRDANGNFITLEDNEVDAIEQHCITAGEAEIEASKAEAAIDRWESRHNPDY